MSLTDLLPDYINACFTGLWIQSHEPDEAEREIAQLARNKDWKIAAWDIAGGLRFPNAPQDSPGQHRQRRSAGSVAGSALAGREGRQCPAAAAQVPSLLEQPRSRPDHVRPTGRRQVAADFLVVLAPVVQIPIELEKLFVILEHPLPDREQLKRIAPRDD